MGDKIRYSGLENEVMYTTAEVVKMAYTFNSKGFANGLTFSITDIGAWKFIN